MTSKCVLILRFKLKSGAVKAFRGMLKEVLDECAKEPTFISTTVHTYPDRQDEVMVYEVWSGTREKFEQEQLGKAYRKPFMERRKPLVAQLEVDWSIPVEEWPNRP